MRREQLGELVNLTSHMPAQRRTAEMPEVELLDLLRRDRELNETSSPSPSPVPVVIAERFDTSCRYDAGEAQEDPPGCELAAGTVRILRRSRAKLMLGCLAAFAGGFGLTLPLWW